MPTSTEIRQLNNGLYVEFRETHLGAYFVYSDYESTDKIPSDYMDKYYGNPAKKIPNHLWNQMVTFFMHYFNSGTEVECRYYYNPSTQVFLCLVADQVVGGASVAYDYSKPIYGLDGKSYDLATLVKDGYMMYAHFHLHPFDMANPSSIDDNNEMKTPALYGIVSIPTNRKSNYDYRIRTTVIANNGWENRRYFTDSWDFIELPTDSELQTYVEVPYAEICTTQVKKFVPIIAKQSKWLAPTKSQTFNYGYTAQPLSLKERVIRALENVAMVSGHTVADIEAILPEVLSELLQDEKAFTHPLFTLDRDINDFSDPFYYDAGV